MNIEGFVKFIANNASKIQSWGVIHRDIGMTIFNVRVNEVSRVFIIPTSVVRKNQAMLDGLRELALDSVWLNNKRKVFIEGYLS